MTSRVFAPTFPASTLSDWQKLVRASPKRLPPTQPAEAIRPAEVEPGIEVSPLYAKDNSPSYSGEGANSLRRGERSFPADFSPAARIEAADCGEALAAMGFAIKDGAGSITLALDRAFRVASPLETANELVGLQGVSVLSLSELRNLLEMKCGTEGLWVEAGRSAVAMPALLKRAKIASADRICVLHDPFSDSLDGAENKFPAKILAAQSAKFLEESNQKGAPRGCLDLNARLIAEAGGSSVQQLSYLLGLLSEWLRAIVPTGPSLDQVSAQLLVTCAAGADIFLELAKFRALRILWGNFWRPLGRQPGLRLRVVSSRWNRTREDAHNNLLRNAAAAFTAFISGADRVEIFPHLLANDEGLPLARRLSVTLQHILRDEALLGVVSDPAGGSFYVEALTDQLAQAAWAKFQEIEKLGGLFEVLRSGSFQRELRAYAYARGQALLTKGQVLVGVSAFRNESEDEKARLSKCRAFDLKAFQAARRLQMKTSEGARQSAQEFIPALLHELLPEQNSGNPSASDSRVEGFAPFCLQQVWDSRLPRSEGGSNGES